MKELKPCFLCGNKATIDDFLYSPSELEFFVRCIACHATGSLESLAAKAADAWNSRPIEDALRARVVELEARCGELEKARHSETLIRRVEIELCNDLPGFGVYLMKVTDSTNQDEPAVILLNLRLAVEAVKACGDSPENVKLIIAETVAHELLHAVQDIVGSAITEAEVQEALSVATGESVEVYDDQAEVSENLYRQTLVQSQIIEAQNSALESVWRAIFSDKPQGSRFSHIKKTARAARTQLDELTNCPAHEPKG
jgi:hypothetical protein